MTTQERLLAEAREAGFTGWIAERVVEIVIRQLRAAKESGHLRHKVECAHIYPDGPCSCGFVDRFGDL